MGEMARYDCYIDCSSTIQLQFSELDMTEVMSLLHLVKNAVIHEKYGSDTKVLLIVSLHEQTTDGKD